MSPCRRAIVVLTITLRALASVAHAAAHPLDELIQHVFVTVEPTELQFTVAVGGGILANELVLGQLDANGDGVASPAEQTAWVTRWAHAVAVSIDGTVLPIDASAVRISVPPLNDFHVGTTPILLEFTL